MALLVEKAGLADKLTVKAEGTPDKELVKEALIAAYPQLTVNLKNGSLCLAIEVVCELGPQI